MSQAGEIRCPWCDHWWTRQGWTTEAKFPAFTLCVYCLEVAYVDVGPFGYMIRTATSEESAHPEMVELRRLWIQANPLGRTTG